MAGAGLVLALVLPPILWALLRGAHSGARRKSSAVQRAGARRWNGAGPGRAARSCATAASIWLLPAVLAPSFVGTALFFHHLALAELKGWSAAWLTGSYWVYAVGTVLATLAAGPLIDRITAVRVLPGFLLPLAVGLHRDLGLRRSALGLALSLPHGR